jgi:hypothetical protein
VWNEPGQNDQFPSLITAVGFHAPGRIIGHGLKLAQRHQEFGFDRFLLIADRAYNAAKVEDFQLPIRKMGIELVVDYPKNQLGKQGEHEDLILVDGNWYVNWMPEHLISGGKELLAHFEAAEAAESAIRHANHQGNKATLKERREAKEGTQYLANALKVEKPIQSRIEARTPYRMTAKGRPDSDGWQRFTYPDPEHMLHNPSTSAKRGSISIPPMLNVKGDAVEPLKHLQKYQWRVRQWREHYGMRSLVESSNNHLKDPDKEDLGNKHKRRGRGFAYHYLACAFMAASSNLRRILTYIQEEAKNVAAAGGSKLPRRRRRKDPRGIPLPRLVPSESLSPPGH